MTSPWVPFLVGAALVVGAVAVDANRERAQASDVRDITALRAQLDSVQATLHDAMSQEDSARAAGEISMRTTLLARREFHVPSRQDALDRWWKWNGGGTSLAAAGAALFLLAFMRNRRSSASRVHR